MLSPDTYLAAIRRDAALLADAARHGFDAAVPACPGWNVGDLVEHTAIVHRHKTQIIEEAWMDGAPDPVKPPPRRKLLDWYEEGVERLLAALSSSAPGRPISTWDSANETVGFWYRRMAQETFVHRVDGEQAHRLESATDPALALDGIAELLDSFIGGAPPWATLKRKDQHVQLAPHDAGSGWTVALGEFSGVSPSTGIRYDAEPVAIVDAAGSGDVDSARVAGSAMDMDLWLWGRRPIEALEVTGDLRLATSLRAVAAAATS